MATWCIDGIYRWIKLWQREKDFCASKNAELTFSFILTWLKKTLPLPLHSDTFTSCQYHGGISSVYRNFLLEDTFTFDVPPYFSPSVSVTRRHFPFVWEECPSLDFTRWDVVLQQISIFSGRILSGGFSSRGKFRWRRLQHNVVSMERVQIVSSK